MSSRASRSLSPVRGRNSEASAPGKSQPSASVRSNYHSRSRSKSLKATIVRTLKSSITKNTKRGQALYKQYQTSVMFTDPNYSFSEMSPKDTRQGTALLLDMQKTAHKLGGLKDNIRVKFNTPEARSDPARDKLFLEVLTAHREAGVDHVLSDLNSAIRCLDGVFRANNIPTQPYDPSIPELTGDEESEGENPEVPGTSDGARKTLSAIQRPLNEDPTFSTTSSPQKGLAGGSISGMTSSDLADLNQQLCLSEGTTHYLQQRIEELQKASQARDDEHRESLRQRREADLSQKQQLLSLERELELARFQESEARRLLDESINHKVALALQEKFAQEVECRLPIENNVVSSTVAQHVPSGGESFFPGSHPPTASHSVIEQFQTAPQSVAPLATRTVNDQAILAELVKQQTQQMLINFEKRMEGSISRQLESLRLHDRESDKRPASIDSVDSEYIRNYENAGDEELEDVAGVAPLPTPVAPTSQIPSHVSDKKEPSAVATLSSLKLESKLKMLPHFDGTSDFEDFIDTMTATVFSLPYTAEAKLFLLKNHLRGSARNCIAPSKDSTTAFAKTMDMLRKVYGKKASRQSLLKQLQALNFSHSDADQMRSDLAALSSLLERVHAKGLSDTDEPTSWTIARKLPQDMLLNVAELLGKRGENVTHWEILEKITEEIETRAMVQNIRDHSMGSSSAEHEIPSPYAFINPVVGGPMTTAGQPHGKPGGKTDSRPLAYNPAHYPLEYLDRITNTKLPGYYSPGPKGINLKIVPRSFPYTNEEPSKCSVCKGPHNAIRCPLSSEEFRAVMKKEGLCPNCAGKHDITKCRSTFHCGYCDGLHHMGGCTLKEYYRDMNNYPTGAKKVETFFRPTTKKSKSQ